MTDREQLAARLVEAAGKAARTADDFGRDTWTSSPRDEQQHFIHMGSAAAVAVLRELADVTVRPSSTIWLPKNNREELRGLADFIEKGTTDGNQ